MNTNLATENSSGVEFRVIHVDFHVNLIFLVDFETGFTGLYDVTKTEIMLENKALP